MNKTRACPPPHRGTFWNSAIRPSVPWRSCLGHRHAGCLRLSNRRPPEMCGLRTRPRTDVDPPRVEPASAGDIVSPSPGRYLLSLLEKIAPYSKYKRHSRLIVIHAYVYRYYLTVPDDSRILRSIIYCSLGIPDEFYCDWPVSP